MIKTTFILMILALFATVWSYRIQIPLNAKQIKSASKPKIMQTERYGSFKRHSFVLCAEEEKKSDDIEETTKKYGLEAGLYKAVTNKEGATVKPQELLAKYGVAYLATSITLAIISYALCYALISNGVDVSIILEKFGIQPTNVASNAGTAAIAYAVHKAASPIRFPPTVALTPIVANWLGKTPKEKSD